MDDPDQFWAKVDKAGPLPTSNPDLGRCWLWTGAVSAGHGRVMVPTADGRHRVWAAHRVSYVLTHGTLPADRPLIDSLCETALCVNPAHLMARSKSEIAQAIIDAGRHPSMRWRRKYRSAVRGIDGSPVQW